MSSSQSSHRAGRALKAVIYLRLSVTREESVSIEKTRAVCIAECEREGFEWSEDRILVDDGMSGGIRRAKADRALEMLRTGEADVLVVWKWDRWSRQGIVAVGDLMDTLLKTTPRTRFIAIEDKLDSTQQFFPLMAAFFAEQGRIERENTKLRVTGSIALLATKGRYFGGITPFGWTPARNEDGPGYHLALCPTQYPVLREIIDRVLMGETVHAITKDLNAREVPSPEGKGWYDNAIRRLLRNPVMRGYFMFHGHPVTGEDGMPIRPNHAAVDDDEWYAIQDALDARSWKGETRRYGHLLAGLAVCAYCKKNMNKRTHNLACSKHTREMVCPGPTISREPLEQFIEDEFLDRYGDMPVMVEVEVEQDTTRIREILEALDIVGKRIAAADDEDEEMELLRMKRRLRQEMKDLETTITGEVTVIRQETGKTYAEEWVRSSVDERRNLLASHIRYIEVTKGQRGGRGRTERLDSSRVTIRWFEDDETEAQEAAA